MENRNWQDIIQRMFLKVVTSFPLRGRSLVLSDDSIPDHPGTRGVIERRDIWTLLAGEGKHDLIKTLQRVERKEPGYGTIVTPKEGWSENDTTHNAVLRWLRDREVNVLNVGVEVECLSRTLHLTQEV